MKKTMKVQNVSNRLTNFIMSLCTVILISSCQQGFPTSNESNDSTNVKTENKIKKKDNFEELFDAESGSIPVFYNMYLTVELSSLFDKTGVAFEKEFLNPAENIENYLTSYKKALNIGIYAVDLSYVKVYDEFDLAGKYFSAMHNLSENLGIPDEFFYSAAKRFEKNISNKDSLAFIANEVYNITDDYLKENNRSNTAALIIVGGWLEAMYLALKVYNNSNNSSIILDKIADQKNSLNEVTKLVDLSEDKNEYIVGILEDMNALQPLYKELSRVYNQADKANPLAKELEEKLTDLRKEMIN